MKYIIIKIRFENARKRGDIEELNQYLEEYDDIKRIKDSLKLEKVNADLSFNSKL